MSVESVPQAESVRVNVDPAAMLIAYAIHRRRFASEVVSLDAAALAQPSRCEMWSVADVLRHLADVDGWMLALWRREPPPFTSFDPNTTPHEFVLAARAMPDEAARDRYMASAEEMAVDIEGSSRDRWGDPSISPLGFVPWWLSVLHIFWDSWLHERDALLPIGVEPPLAGDELEPIVAYSLAIAGMLMRDHVDMEVAGIRVATDAASALGPSIIAQAAGGAPLGAVDVTPVGDAPPADVAALIDAIAGRGDVDAVLGSFDAHNLGGLARLFGRGA